MKARFKKIILFFTIILFVSCVDNLYFDQANFEIEPVINAPLVYFELNQNSFFNETTTLEISSITDISSFEVLKLPDLRNNLIKAIFTFEVKNSFDRNFEINVDFLDDNDNITYSISDIDLSPGNLNYRVIDTLQIATSPIFLNTKKIRVDVNLIPSSSQIDPNIYEILQFKSTGTFHLSI
tara:strand:- start:4072 stop:4614 length:543 start_codon:yes stop_codon:yes gene_type:complete